MTKNLVPMMI